MLSFLVELIQSLGVQWDLPQCKNLCRTKSAQLLLYKLLCDWQCKCQLSSYDLFFLTCGSLL